MNYRFSLPLALCSCLLLSACDDNAPRKSDVEHTLREQAVNRALQFQGILNSLLGDDGTLARKKQEITSQIDKDIQVDSVSCSKVEGFKSVYDCTVNAIIDGNTRTSQYRFIRHEDGSFTGKEKD